MAPGQIPRPTRRPNPAPAPRPSPNPRQAHARAPLPQEHQTSPPPIDLQHELWLRSAMDRFHRLILYGQSEPSNGTVRKVERPDGERHFNLAYGNAPDDDLLQLLETIYAKHGELSLYTQGRDSTGKHWIGCYNEFSPRNVQYPIEKAVICVSSRFELATVTHRLRYEAIRDGKPWPPKVPGAVKDAPKNLYFLPRSEQLPWLEPAAAEALRGRIDAEAWAEAFQAARWARRGAVSYV